MSLTNFGKLTDEELTIWQRDTWRKARNESFMGQFTGTDHNSMIQRITELKKSQKGARAVITLVNDSEGDGVAGDRTLEGNEETLTSEDQVIRIDQLRHAHRHEGKMADQKSVVTFRKEARDNLSYWLADRYDQQAFLALSGVDFSMHTNGVARVGSDFPNLEYAADLAVPSDRRYYRWDATNGLISGAAGASNADLTTADTLTWEMLIDLRAEAEEDFLRPVRTVDGVNMYHVFVTPTAMKSLKKDQDFKENLRNAGARSNKNPLFKGSESYYVDGLAIHSYRHVYNTRKAASGSKWGGGAVDGCRLLFCGAQSLGFADIGSPEWKEKGFDYDNQQGIAVGKIAGFLKPQFKSKTYGTKQDFGVITVDIAQ